MTAPRSSRRHFLRSGSVMLALPWLASLSQRAQAAAPPLRLVLVFNPNGTIQDEYWPSEPPGSTTFTLGSILSPLQPYQKQLLLPKGISNQVASIGPGGPHQKGIGGLFTGRELLAGTFADGCGSQAGYAAGISIDQLLVSDFGQDTFLPSLELGVRSIIADVQSRISYAGPNRPLPPMTSPRAVFSRLFEGGSPTPAVLDAEHLQQRSVLDQVLGQIKSLSARVSANDRKVLEQHAGLVRDLERRLGLAGSSCKAPAKPPDLNQDSQDTMQQIGELQVDLMALALGCGLTRVGSLQFSEGYNRITMPWVNSQREGHPLSHAGMSDPTARAELLVREHWYGSMVARLMDRLGAMPEGHGTVLDNTLILWGNEIGIGATHTHDNLPLVLAGGAGGKLRMGQFLDFKGRSHCDLLLTVLHAMGRQDKSFGHPDFNGGILPGLLR